MSVLHLSWSNPPKTKIFDVDFEFPAQNFEFVPKDFGLAIDSSAINGVSAIFDIGNKLGRAGAFLGACLNGLVHQFFGRIPVPFKRDDSDNAMLNLHVDVGGERSDMGLQMREDLGSMAEQLKERFTDAALEGVVDEGISGLYLNIGGLFGRSQGTFNITTTYDSRKKDVGSSLAARGDLWRLELSNGSSTLGNENSSLFLVQLGPVLFVRDTTLLLPVHLSKQHFLWYGYDRKSFMDVQFPNGQLTYVAGEGITTSAFLPVFGGLLQAQGQYPGEMKFSFSCKVSEISLSDICRIIGEHALPLQFNGLINRSHWALSRLWLGNDLVS